MKNEKHPYIDGNPGRIKECKHAIASQELAHLNQVAECTRLRATRLVEVSVKTSIEYPGAQLRIQAHSGPHQHPRAHPLRKRHHTKQKQRNDR